MRLPISLLTLTAVALVFSGCGKDPEEPDGFSTQTSTMTNGDDTSGDATSSEAGTGGDSTGTTDTGTTDTGTTDTGTTDTGTTDTGSTDTGSTDTGSTGTTSGAMCGNGTIETGEQCDGSMLNGFTCVDLGFSGGTLACDPVTCTYDTANCTTNGGTTG